MYLDKLDEPRLRRLYEQEMKRDFPPTELKPLRTMCALMAQGRYDVIGLYEDGTLLGYALLWLEPGVPFALLDYLGTLPGVRNRGWAGSFSTCSRSTIGRTGASMARRRPRRTAPPPARPCAGGGSASICATASVTAAMTAPCSASTIRS